MDYECNPDCWRIRRAQGGYVVTSLDPDDEEDEETLLSPREHITLTPESAALMLYRYLCADVKLFSPSDDELKQALGIN